MKQFIFWTLVLLSGCSTKKESFDQSKVKSESTFAIDSNSTPAKPKGDEFKVEFILDNLLKFDSEAELKKYFGDNVKRSVGYQSEGMGTYPNTILFSSTRNEVEFLWSDTISFSGLVHITITGYDDTDWKTEEGITLGTNLKELEKLNHKPFKFYGFSWDLGGSVNWDDGQLKARKIYVRIDYPGDGPPMDLEGLIGDHEIQSDSELAQKANPVVFQISMWK